MAATAGILIEENHAFKIRLEGFEGPLDLLLHLIRKSRYDIYDIPIAQILREYLAVLEVLRELDLDVAGEFLVMAATLAAIKSRMLLPVPVAEEEGGDEGKDPRAELVRRLVEYEQFREAALSLDGRSILGRDVFARTWRPAELDDLERPDVPLQGDLYELLLAFHELLREAPEEFVHDVARQRVSIQEAIQEILDHFQQLPPGMGLSFRDLFPPRPSRDRIVATFLALLELIRLRAARVQQVEAFGEIRIQPVPPEGE
ncbi:MAG: segregation/condensation protein A [Deltaproteobacteria bacterium]|nr:segregation/condensation protein A [Deltaproteobacteria bacterium]